MSDVRWPCLDNKMLFTEFKKAMKDQKLQDYQLKELEQKLNDETSKVRKLESSNEILSKKVRPIYTGLEEIFMERFVLTDPHLLSGADSKNEILGYWQYRIARIVILRLASSRKRTSRPIANRLENLICVQHCRLILCARFVHNIGWPIR